MKPASAPFTPPKVIGAEVARVFSDRIIHLEWPPGMRLIEEDLCDAFRISRSPLRDAFQMLEADGLIVRAAWRGVRVAPMNEDDLDEVYKCRAALEGLVAAEAARAADADTLAALGRLLGEMRTAMETDDVAAFFDHNIAFTRAVHAASGNHTLVRLVSGIEKQAMRYRYLAHLRTREIVQLSFDGDRKVLDALTARKPELARREAVRMIRYAHRVIAQVVAEIDPAEWRPNPKGLDTKGPVLGPA